MNVKRCWKCKEIRELIWFPKDKKYADGHSGRCCVCFSLMRAPNRAVDDIIARKLLAIERQQLKAEGRRRCASCKLIKTIKGDFYPGSSCKTHSYCKDCSNTITRHVVSQPKRRLYNRKKRRAYAVFAAVQVWAQLSHRAHRDRGTATTDDLVALIPAGIGRCTYCHHEVRVGCNASVDIIEPSIGFEINNITLCCRPCNSAKGNKTGDEYTQWLSEAPELLEDTQYSNECMLKKYYASVIPFSILKEMAAQWLN